jgi:hypothetical protein
MVCGDTSLGKLNLIEDLLLSLNRDQAEKLLKDFKNVDEFTFGYLSDHTESMTTFTI